MREVLINETLATTLQQIYDTPMVDTSRALFDWNARNLFADALLDSEKLIPVDSVPPTRREAIARIVCDIGRNIPSLGESWYKERRRALAELYNEVSSKLNRERNVLNLSKHTRNSGVRPSRDKRASLHSLEAANMLTKQSMEINQQTQAARELLADLEHVERDQHYNNDSLVEYAFALLMMMILGVVFSVTSLDVAVMCVSLVVLTIASVWIYLVCRWAPGKFSLGPLTIYLILSTFGYLVFSLMRSTVYRYGDTISGTVVLVLVWCQFALLLGATCSAVVMLAARKYVRRIASHVKLPSHTSPALKVAYGNKSE